MKKKTRFEIFKRDGFACVYCGKSPPSVILEVDHIEPVSKGGKNDINNYITACFDCNRGKGNIPLDKVPPKLSENLEILKLKEEQLKEYRKFIKGIERREKKDIEDINKIYTNKYIEWELADHFKKTSLKKFLSLLPKHEVIEAMEIACNKIDSEDLAIKYFCGICWQKIKADDPKTQIRRMWVELSRHYGRGIGYYDKSDLLLIEDIHIETLKKYMNQALSKRSNAYWRSFIELIKNDGLI